MNDFESILKSRTRDKKLMIIFPHPDDETMATGGLLLKAAEYGWETVVFTLTKGEAGQCYISKNLKTLSEIRTYELKSALRILKSSKLILGNFSDSKVRNQAVEVKKWVKAIINDENPSVVVTYDPSGFTGHPDHISLSVIVLQIFKELKPNKELFWATVPNFLSKYIIAKRTIKYNLSPSHVLDIGSNWKLKLKAVREHKSQRLEHGNILLFLFFAIFHREWYYKVDLSKKYKHKFVYFKI